TGTGEHPMADFARSGAFTPYTAIYNVTGQPAITLPVRFGEDGLPTSVQRPHPPILVGGGGPKLLAYAAREADIIGLDPRSLPQGGHDPQDVTEAAIDRKVGWIREAAGDRWNELEINIAIYAVDPPPEAGRDIGPEELERSPHYLVGDAERIADTLLERRERWGLSYIVIGRGELDVMRPVIARLAGR
ncbi:MAG: hypothetical protein KY392_07430, partial [Chloroflexi bacterium]|nr:hypothetical protein [Chloroflexota bacterium]